MIGAIDALGRRLALGRALRDDRRRAAARTIGCPPPIRGGPRSAAPLARDDVGVAVAGATLVVLGDDLAVAIAWHPVRCPNPVRVASGHGARASQIVAYARRYQVAIHREPALASLVSHHTAISEEAWPRLAEIIAACVRGNNAIAVRQRER